MTIRKRGKYSNLFNAPESLVLGWLGRQGYTGQLTDGLVSYFQTRSGLATGASLSDHINRTLSNLGYTGTMQDKLYAFYVAKTGISYAPDAERAFWDSNLTFGGGGIDSNTVLMLAMTGADTSTDFPDTSLTPKTVTAAGGAAISTAQTKFGSGVGKFNTANARLSIPNSSDWNFGSGDFTIDTWIYMTAAPAVAGTIWGADITNTTSNMYLRVDTNRQAYADFNGGSGGGGWSIAAAAGTAIALNQWVHVALVRSGNNWNIYIDGTSGSSTTNAGSITDQSTTRCIGGVDVDDRNIVGYLSTFRVSKGVARWTSNFTPPTEAYST